MKEVEVKQHSLRYCMLHAAQYCTVNLPDAVHTGTHYFPPKFTYSSPVVPVATTEEAFPLNSKKNDFEKKISISYDNDGGVLMRRCLLSAKYRSGESDWLRLKLKT